MTRFLEQIEVLSPAQFILSGFWPKGWPFGAVETAPIDARDIAAVAVRALIDEGHAGRDYVITGPESLSQADQVRVIGNALGRRLRFHELSPDEFRRETAFPRPAVDMLLAAWPPRREFRPT